MGRRRPRHRLDDHRLPAGPVSGRLVRGPTKTDTRRRVLAPRPLDRSALPARQATQHVQLAEADSARLTSGYVFTIGSGRCRRTAQPRPLQCPRTSREYASCSSSSRVSSAGSAACKAARCVGSRWSLLRLMNAVKDHRPGATKPLSVGVMLIRRQRASSGIAARTIRSFWSIFARTRESISLRPPAGSARTVAVDRVAPRGPGWIATARAAFHGRRFGSGGPAGPRPGAGGLPFGDLDSGLDGIRRRHRAQLERFRSCTGQPSKRAPSTAAWVVNRWAGSVGSYPVSDRTRSSR